MLRLKSATRTPAHREILKVLHVNTYDHAGGAARAAYRLHKGLRLLNQESCMLSGPPGR